MLFHRELTDSIIYTRNPLLYAYIMHILHVSKSGLFHPLEGVTFATLPLAMRPPCPEIMYNADHDKKQTALEKHRMLIVTEWIRSISGLHIQLSPFVSTFT